MFYQPHVGRFWFYFADERWEWSPEVADIHGYPPATSGFTKGKNGFRTGL